MRTIAFRLAAVALVAGAAALAAQDEGPCDPGLEADRESLLGYREIEPRHCEGLYVRRVARGMEELAIASLTAGFEEYDPRRGDSLLLEWSARGEGTLRLRANGLRPSLYYRMDAQAPAGDGAYEWRPGILRRLGLHRADIGLLAWTGSGEDRCLVPLRVRQRRPATPPASYRLRIVPGNDLDEVFWSLERPGSAPLEGRLGSGSYLRGVPLDLELDIGALRDDPGIYDLEVSATLLGGGVVSRRFHLCHPEW